MQHHHLHHHVPAGDLFFGGVTSLTLSLDKPVLVVLRDGRVLVGTLSSYDHFGSLVLESTKERISAGGKFADVYMGLYMVRGDNIVLLGDLVRWGINQSAAPPPSPPHHARRPM